MAQNQFTTASLNVRLYRMVQNYHLVCLIDENNSAEYQNSIAKLQHVVNTIHTFIKVNDCIHFINSIKEEKTFLITSGAFSQRIIPVIHNKIQVSAIYILDENKTRHEVWMKDWLKVKGVFTDITLVCEALMKAAYDCDHNTISISFYESSDEISNENLHTSNSSFLYTQVLKEILRNIDSEQGHFNEFLAYCREIYVDNTIELGNIDKIEKEYCEQQPIWWYTYPCFLYPMLNRALRLVEIDRIIRMDFFVHDLHQQITTQDTTHQQSDAFTVFRGQGLSQIDFEQLKKKQNGLIVFNNFLSTSKHRDLALEFAKDTITTSDLVGVLFVITIDPSISDTYFANFAEINYYQDEEILFSVYSIFRIEQVKQLDENDRLWQVNLTLTNDNDPQLQTLTKRIQEETQGSTGWFQLGKLMIKLGQFDRAEELYESLLQLSTNENEKAHLFNQLGWIKNNQGKYEDAITYYEKALDIEQNITPSNDSDLATCYNNTGSVYYNIGEYSKALSSHEKALEIYQKTLPINDPLIATCYNNIGLVYKNMGEHLKALSCYEQALDILQKNFPEDHPKLGGSYNNIGLVYRNVGDHSKALSYHEKALEIFEKSLPEGHIDLATSYNNIGLVYKKMGEYSKALTYYVKDLEISQKILPANHPDLATSYNNIGAVYYNLGQYSQALSYYGQALEIFQQTLPSNHPDLATAYNNIGNIYNIMGEYTKALPYCLKDLEILEKTGPVDHPSLATSYNNLGFIYENINDHVKALSYFERALAVKQSFLPSNHPGIVNLRETIGLLKKKL